MRTLRYDVVVVGAGPAGSSAAKAAAESHVSVLLMDQRSSIGVPVQCAEFIPRLLLRELDVDRRCIARDVEIMRTYLPDGQASEVQSPGYLLDRALFDRSLAASAIEAGAHFLSRTRMTALAEGAVLAQQGDEQIRVEAGVVIGADGPRSCVGRWTGQVNTSFVQAMQYEVALNEESAATEVFFDRDYPGGYAWLFPKRQTANVGVGVASGLPHGSLRATLDRFLGKLVALGKVKGEGIVGATAGQIPVGGYLRTVVGNVLLVGDAAGQTHPITGAGVAQAVLCGRMAGEVAGRALRGRDPGLLGEYERQWKQLFAAVLDTAVARRKLLESRWGGSDLHELIRRCWVGFKEYAR